jgi:adenylate cyclase
MTNTTPVVQWLIDGARSAPTPEDTLVQLCTRLVASGVRLDRAGVYVQTLHPNIMGRAFRWRPESGVEVNEAPTTVLGTDLYRLSPVARVSATASSLRRRLADANCTLDFPILKDLREEGFTDYVCAPLIFANGEVHAIVWSTKAPGGFAEDEIAGLEAINAPLARVAEIWALRRIAVNLLNTYVGRQSGARVLAGHIHRGDTEDIEAVIWLSDLRGFTSKTEDLPPRDTIAILNRFFDCQTPAIAQHGGEVLKFIGDGLLAIFPVAGSESARDVCEAALRAVRATETALAETTARDLPYGLALHIGNVSYGNIGGGDRLDFTCIGPAVNMTARLEKLSGDIKRPIVASETFARHVPRSFAYLGDFALKGFGGRQPVYGLEPQEIGDEK